MANRSTRLLNHVCTRCGEAPASPDRETCGPCSEARAQQAKDRRARCRALPAARLARDLYSAARRIRTDWRHAPAESRADLLALHPRLAALASLLNTPQPAAPAAQES